MPWGVLWPEYCLLYVSYINIWGVKIGLPLRHPPPNDKDVGSNPAAIGTEKNAHWTDPCTEGAPIVQQDLSGRPAM